MGDLIKAKLIKYLRSPLTYIAAVVSLASGICGGAYCMNFRDEVGTVINCPADDMWMLTAIWAAIVLVAMCVGREFSDGTIRNKIVSGHTKASIFLSEVTAAAVVTAVIYLLDIIPTAIGAGFFFSAIPTFSVVKWFIDMFLTFELMSIFAVAITCLFAKRAVGVVAAFALHFVLYIMVGLTEGYYYNIGEPQISTVTLYTTYENGTVKETQQECVNKYYIEGFPKVLVQIEHTVNPMYGMVDTAGYGYILDETEADDQTLREGKQREDLLNFNIFKMLGYCTIATGAGTYLFRKKDLK